MNNENNENPQTVYEQLKMSLSSLTEQYANESAELEVIVDEEQELIEKLRSLRQEKLEKQAQQKKVSLRLQNTTLRLHNIEESLRKIQEEEKQKAEENEAAGYISQKVLKVLEGSSFYEKLLPFQKEDVLIIGAQYLRGARGILNANDMGLGKTFESAAADYILSHLFMEKHGRKPNVLWLTKKSLVRSSTREFLFWRPERSIMPIIDLPPSQREMLLSIAIGNGAMVITNYDTLAGSEEFQKVQWDIIFVDEVHKLKGGSNPRPTKIFTETQAIANKCDFIVMLSGSPLQNHPREMWCYLTILEPTRFGSLKRFERDYCGWFDAGLGVSFDKVIGILRDQVIRRKATDVQLQLPPITRQVIEVELYDRQRALYQQMKENFFIWLDEREGKALSTSVVIAQLTRLRQLALYAEGLQLTDPVGSAKVDEAMDIIEQLDEHEQIVIFSAQFNPPLYEIQKRCREFLDVQCEIIDGSSKDVNTIEQNFQQGRTKVLCINGRSGSEGLNLQKSDKWPGGAAKAIFLDLWWNPEINRQCEARVYRQGQTDHVHIYILHATDTVDNFMRDLNAEKAAITEGIMDSDALIDKSNWKTYLRDSL